MKVAVLVSVCLFIFGSLANSDAASPSGGERTPFISHDAILKLMNEAQDRTDKTRTNFASVRNPLDGNANREGMKEFIAFKMSQLIGAAGGGEEGHQLKRDIFRTQILNSAHQPVAVDGTNVIAILKGTNSEKRDKPLLIVANYDTDANTANPVADNGAGVAAMLVLADFMAKELKAGNYKLQNTLIFAATDLSFRKYVNSQNGNLPPNSTTGSDRIAKEFLPEFLGDRQLRGVIVLDSILNYKEEANTETAAGFSKIYPEAYQIMSNQGYAGNFLALVNRPTDLDQELKNKIKQGWERAAKQPKETDTSLLAQVTPNLIVFEHKAEDESGEAFLYFLQSDQYSFWNHHLRLSPSYPAVLLTDTGKYRTPICYLCSRIEDSTSPKNLAFAHRTILTLYNVVKDLQTNAGSASSVPISSGVAIVTTIMALGLRYIMTMDI